MNNDIVYLATASSPEKSEIIEKLLKGENVKGNIGSTNYEGFHSQVIERVNLSSAKNIHQRLVMERDAAATEANATYFYYSNSIDELREYMCVLLGTPNGIESYNKADRGAALSNDETIGGGKATLFVASIPSATLDNWIISGQGERREGEYGTDNCKTNLPEVALGDKAVKDLLKNGTVLEYDRLNKAMNNAELWSVPTTFFGGKPYTPEFEIIYKDKSAQNSPEYATIKESEITESKDILEARNFLANLEQSGASAEDIAIARSAVADLINYKSTQHESEDNSPEISDN